MSEDLVLLDVLEEHLEEFDLLWERRQREIVSPDGRPASLATLESRMAAHLEGLRIGGASSLGIAQKALPGAKGSSAFAAAYVLLALGDADDEEAVRAALEVADAEAADGLRHALRHGGTEHVLTFLPALMSDPHSPASVAALDALAFHRKPVTVGLGSYVTHPDPWVREVAWGAAGRLGASLSGADLQAGFEDREPRVARAALEASCWMGRRDALEWSRRGTARAGNGDRWAAAMLGILGEAKDVAALIAASRAGPVADAALLGIGYLGERSGVERAMEAMSDPSLTVAAGEAFRQITGADIDAREEPKEPQAPERPIGDPAEFLPERPTPDRARAGTFWKRRGSEFRAGTRYRFGVELAAKGTPADLQGRLQALLRAGLAGGTPVPPAEDHERFELR
jgi:uncharacterized protein (TIGR02270 family)